MCNLPSRALVFLSVVFLDISAACLTNELSGCRSIILVLVDRYSEKILASSFGWQGELILWRCSYFFILPVWIQTGFIPMSSKPPTFLGGTVLWSSLLMGCYICNTCPVKNVKGVVLLLEKVYKETCLHLLKALVFQSQMYLLFTICIY